MGPPPRSGRRRGRRASASRALSSSRRSRGQGKSHEGLQGHPREIRERRGRRSPVPPLPFSPFCPDFQGGGSKAMRAKGRKKITRKVMRSRERLERAVQLARE